MRASKEECRTALGRLTALSDALPAPQRTALAHHIIWLETFLEAALKRLPSEAAYNTSAARSRERARHKRRA